MEVGGEWNVFSSVMLHCIFFNPDYQLSTEPRQCQSWQEEGSFQLPIQDPFFSAVDLGRTWIGLEAWIGSWRRALAAAPLFVLCATVPACLAQGQSHRLHSTDSAASSAIIAPVLPDVRGDKEPNGLQKGTKRNQIGKFH